VYSSYQSRSITVAATDAGYATGLVTAGRKARVVLYLSLYSGTNTATSAINFGVSGVNEDNSPGNEWNYAAAGANPFYMATQTSGIVSNFTQLNPDNIAPSHDKQNNAGVPIIIPPEHVFSSTVADTNLNGTIVVNIITAEIGE